MFRTPAPPPLNVLHDWYLHPWGHFYRISGLFEGREWVTSAVLDCMGEILFCEEPLSNYCPFDEGMEIRTETGSRYLLGEKRK